jgi:hypothetical protein
MTSLTCDQIARAALDEPVKREGAESLYRCPYPERHRNGDSHPSLKINTQKNTWACFVCGVSGTAWQLAAFLARLDPSDKSGVTAWLTERGSFSRKLRAKAANGRGPRVAEYVYCDSNGTPAARKLRFEPGRDGRKKEFAWERCDNGEWIEGLAGLKTPLYRLAEIRNEAFVILTEGEKDADAGAQLGLTTTTSGGVNSFRGDHADMLRGKSVVIVADADDPGREDAQKRAAMLYGKAVNVRVCEIPGSKDLAEAIEKGVPKSVLLALFEDAPDWKPSTGAEILDSLFQFIRRFIALTENQARIATLWAAHTHAIDAAEFTPYLNVNSPEKESGKSRLLEVLALLVSHPWKTENASPAAIVRKIHAGFEAGEPVTVLFDERDSQVGGDRERAETVRGILNSGYERGGSYSRCVGEGTKMHVVDFRTFSAKALAGIGALSDTVASRSIPLRMKRVRSGEVQRFRKRDVESETSENRAKLSAWSQANVESLRAARPEIPLQLSDRQADCCEPLIAIADLAGGQWPEAARRALVELCTEAQADDQSTGARLLADIRQIFTGGELDRISSADLVEALAAIETSPWTEWSHGKPLTTPKLARMLGRFGIAPDSIRFGDCTRKGYRLSDFEDAFSRYLLSEKWNNGTSSMNTSENASSEGGAESPCSASESATNRNRNGPCSGVPVSRPLAQAQVDSGKAKVASIAQTDAIARAGDVALGSTNTLSSEMGHR